MAVSGAFHTSRMDSAAAALRQVLSEVRIARGAACALLKVPHQATIKEPRIPVYSNVTGLPFVSADTISELLARQLTEPVQWEGSVKALVSAGKRELLELGPGTQIKAMIKRIDGEVWKSVRNVQP